MYNPLCTFTQYTACPNDRYIEILHGGFSSALNIMFYLKQTDHRQFRLAVIPGVICHTTKLRTNS